MADNWYAGNANDAACLHRGWLLGSLHQPRRRRRAGKRPNNARGAHLGKAAGLRASMDRNLCAREYRLARIMRCFTRRRLGPIR